MLQFSVSAFNHLHQHTGHRHRGLAASRSDLADAVEHYEPSTDAHMSAKVCLSLSALVTLLCSALLANAFQWMHLNGTTLRSSLFLKSTRFGPHCTPLTDPVWGEKEKQCPRETPSEQIESLQLDASFASSSSSSCSLSLGGSSTVKGFGLCALLFSRQHTHCKLKSN